MELGAWATKWDAEAKQVMLTFIVPRGVTVLAGGTVQPDAKAMKLSAEVGSEVFGICSGPFLGEEFKTVRYDIELAVNDDGSSVTVFATRAVDVLVEPGLLVQHVEVLKDAPLELQARKHSRATCVPGGSDGGLVWCALATLRLKRTHELPLDPARSRSRFPVDAEDVA